MTGMERRYPLIQVYVSEADEPLWERVRQAAGPRKLSEFITQAVRIRLGETPDVTNPTDTEKPSN